jgi:hypothetical protein
VADVVTIAAAAKRIDDLEAAVNEIGGFHERNQGVGIGYCIECNQLWPCRTTEALEVLR